MLDAQKLQELKDKNILSEEERLALNVAMGKDGAKEAAKEREERKPEIGY